MPPRRRPGGSASPSPRRSSPDAEAEASRRLGWLEAVTVSLPLVPQIVALREELVAKGLTRIVLAGMGGSSLAPEVIAQTAGVPLVILDSTSPGQVLAALDGDRCLSHILARAVGPAHPRSLVERQ